MVGRQWVVKDPSHRSEYLLPCLAFLCETTGVKMRYRNVEARGICVWATLQSGEMFRLKRMFKSSFYTNQEVYRRAMELFNQRPRGAVIRTIGVYCYNLEPSKKSQLSMFENVAKIGELTKAMDEINEFYGKMTLHMAITIEGKKIIKQKIPFGGVEYFSLLLEGSKPVSVH